MKYMSKYCLSLKTTSPAVFTLTEGREAKKAQIFEAASSHLYTVFYKTFKQPTVQKKKIFPYLEQKNQDIENKKDKVR